MADEAPTPADTPIAPQPRVATLPPQYDPNDHPDSQLEALTMPFKPATLPPPPAPAPTIISKRLKRQALEAGISEATISRCDEDTLEELVDRYQAQAREIHEGKIRQQALQDALRAVPQQQPGVSTPQTVAPEDDLGIDLTEVHPALAEGIKKLHKDNLELKRFQAESMQREVNRVAQTQRDLIDEAFESLGEDYHSVFGKGAVGAEVQTTSAEFKRRVAVLQASGLDLSKQPPGKAIKNAVIQAAKELFPAAKPAPAQAPADPYAQALGGNVTTPDSPPPTPRPTPPKDPRTGKFLTAEERTIQKQADDAQAAWLNGALARPSGQNGAPEPPSVKKATETVSAILKERSTPVGIESNGDAQLDDFPS